MDNRLLDSEEATWGFPAGVHIELKRVFARFHTHSCNSSFGRQTGANLRLPLACHNGYCPWMFTRLESLIFK